MRPFYSSAFEQTNILAFQIWIAFICILREERKTHTHTEKPLEIRMQWQSRYLDFIRLTAVIHKYQMILIWNNLQIATQINLIYMSKTNCYNSWLVWCNSIGVCLFPLFRFIFLDFRFSCFIYFVFFGCFVHLAFGFIPSISFSISIFSVSNSFDCFNFILFTQNHDTCIFYHINYIEWLWYDVH